MIITLDPFDKIAVEDAERKSVGHLAEESLADSAEPAFDLAPTFGLIRFGVDEGDPQGGGHVAEMAGGESGTVVNVEFAGQAAFGQGLAQGVGVGFDPSLR